MSGIIVYKAEKGDTVWIKVSGRGTFQNSISIKKLLLEKIESGAMHVIVDLAECDSMDSTFMGIMTGVSVRLKGLGREKLVLANVNPHNIRLLETLGLDKFLEIKEKYEIDGSVKWEELPVEETDKLSITKHMVDAHKQLIDTGKSAEKQFKSVHELLSNDLERQIKKDKN